MLRSSRPRPVSSFAPADTSATTPPSSSPPPHSRFLPPLNPTGSIVHRMLSTYVCAIRRDEYLPGLNRRLREGSSWSAGASNGEAAREYYASRPHLRAYTLGVELDRDSDYTLILKDGTAVVDKDGIRRHFGDGGDRGGGRRDDDREEGELLLRAANQSLLADALAALAGDEGVLHRRTPPDGKTTTTDRLVLPGPVLSMSCVVERCHYAIDLRGGAVEAICVLAVSVPDRDARLVLARGILVAGFRPGSGKDDGGGGGGGLRYEMQMVKAHHHPGSRALYDAAMSLGRDIDRLRSQDGHDYDDDDDAEGRSSSSSLR